MMSTLLETIGALAVLVSVVVRVLQSKALGQSHSD
jgi:hypothetical protein